MDAKEELINDICLQAHPFLRDVSDLKNVLYMLMDRYDISVRCTALSERHEDRNAYLMKCFLVAKTVKGCSGKTLRYYAGVLKKVLAAIGKTVDEITADDIRRYLALRQMRDRISKVTADNELRCLRSFFQYLLSEELIVRNPTAKVDRVKCEKKQKEAFTEIEIEKIRMAASDERERALVEVMLSTGCRVSELVQIMLSDMEGNRVVVHGKGAKDRRVYLNARAMVVLEAYLKQRRDQNPYLFATGSFETARNAKAGWWKEPEKVKPDGHLDTGTVENMMRKLAKKAEVEKANPHKFRRTCATLALRRGMPIEQVSRMLGHEEIATTQIYLDLSEEELEQAHKRYVV